ncbi:hypothetical protein A7U60_g4775 [Sanghuangporus baumii]|uniref:Uncharacterized protein n=1 Tax=Sanghuangporus baumii TaxID=108892 RepID=A0A9Q5HYA3_SANBA|nr:hypothetical protein A7U60_g4775 [Sanghuangporus baumii]
MTTGMLASTGAAAASLVVLEDQEGLATTYAEVVVAVNLDAATESEPFSAPAIYVGLFGGVLVGLRSIALTCIPSSAFERKAMSAWKSSQFEVISEEDILSPGA